MNYIIGYIVLMVAICVGAGIYDSKRTEERTEALAVLICLAADDCTVPQEVLNEYTASE